jgi:hypothetical protein
MDRKRLVSVDEPDRVLLEAAKNVGLHHAYGINHTKGYFNVHGVTVSPVSHPDYTDEEDRIHYKDGAWIMGSGR